jgi:AcrR family transcriptional regulator
MTPQPSTRDRLIESAQRLLWDVGYDAMSPRLVIQDSGVGQGSLYHHFKGKKELALAALDGLAEDLIQKAAACLSAPDQPPLARVEAWLTMPRYALKGCRMGRLTPEQALDDGTIIPPIAHYFTAVESALTKTLTEAQSTGTLNPTLNAAHLAKTLIATVQGGYVLSRAHMDPQAMNDAISGTRSLLALARLGGED